MRTWVLCRFHCLASLSCSDPQLTAAHVGCNSLLQKLIFLFLFLYAKYTRPGNESTRQYDLLFWYFKQHQITTIWKRSQGPIYRIDIVVNDLQNETNFSWHFQASPNMALNMKQRLLRAPWRAALSWTLRLPLIYTVFSKISNLITESVLTLQPTTS